MCIKPKIIDNIVNLCIKIPPKMCYFRDPSLGTGYLDKSRNTGKLSSTYTVYASVKTIERHWDKEG